MGSYLQQYGVEDERRSRVTKRIVIACVVALVAAIAGYLFFHNYPEKRTAGKFISLINTRDYQGAYRDWGCTDQHPCPNYSFQRFMNDWGPQSKAATPWKVASVDGCKSFVTVNVQAQGAELQSLAIQRDDHSLGFAPSPECQEKQWRWGQFFHRIFHGGK
ncbi:MAG: hypothetical protein M3Y57_15625 [Acidobacteriota bacterium]|nr:hypothetical protein [Acidobacteriota bacterium]